MSLYNGNISLDHIAVAVEDLSSAQKIFGDIGLIFNKDNEVVPEESVITSFAPIGDEAKLELISPLNNEGPLKKFIDKNGPGIHHFCFKVDDITKLGEELLKKGYSLIYDKPRKGAGGNLINFIHPKSTGGVLIELSQNENK